MKTKKLEILKNSLDRKESVLNQKFDSHFVDVKHGNGQPMNDKRNGQATMSRWEKQSDSIRNQLKEIEKTKRAIEIEETKIFGCENILENLPQAFLDCLDKIMKNKFHRLVRKSPIFAEIISISIIFIIYGDLFLIIKF